MQKYNFSASYCKSNWSFNYLELSVNNVQSRADISALVPWRNFFSVIPGVNKCHIKSWAILIGQQILNLHHRFFSSMEITLLTYIGSTVVPKKPLRRWYELFNNSFFLKYYFLLIIRKQVCNSLNIFRNYYINLEKYCLIFLEPLNRLYNSGLVHIIFLKYRAIL